MEVRWILYFCIYYDISVMVFDFLCRNFIRAAFVSHKNKEFMQNKYVHRISNAIYRVCAHVR